MRRDGTDGGTEVDFMPAVRGKDKASDVPADGAEGVSAVLPKVQAGEPDQREKFQNGNSKCQTLRRSADQRTWSCVALFCPERRKEVRVKQTVYPRAMDTQTVDLQSVGQPGRYCDRKRRVDWLRGGDSVRRAIPAIQAGDLAALEALAQEQQQSQKIKK